jgi:hypothetical protein
VPRSNDDHASVEVIERRRQHPPFERPQIRQIADRHRAPDMWRQQANDGDVEFGDGADGVMPVHLKHADPAGITQHHHLNRVDDGLRLRPFLVKPRLHPDFRLTSRESTRGSSIDCEKTIGELR